MAWKDIAVLLQRGPEKGFGLEDVTMSDVTLAVDIKDLPLYGLGETRDPRALEALIAIVKGK